MVPRDVAVSRTEYSTSPPFQLHPWLVASFILALNDGTSNRRSPKDIWHPVTVGVDSFQLLDHEFAPFAHPRTWIESLRETLQTCNREWIYLDLYLRLAWLLLLLLLPLQRSARGTLQTARNMRTAFFILAGVASSTIMFTNDVMDCPHGPVDGVDAAVVTADFGS